MLHVKPELSASHAELLFYMSLNTNGELESSQETVVMPPILEEPSSRDLSINKVTVTYILTWVLRTSVLFSNNDVDLTRAAYSKGWVFQAFGIG